MWSRAVVVVEWLSPNHTTPHRTLTNNKTTGRYKIFLTKDGKRGLPNEVAMANGNYSSVREVYPSNQNPKPHNHHTGTTDRPATNPVYCTTYMQTDRTPLYCTHPPTDHAGRRDLPPVQHGPAGGHQEPRAQGVGVQGAAHHLAQELRVRL